MSGSTQVLFFHVLFFVYGAITLYRSSFQMILLNLTCYYEESYNPDGTRPLVWALPRSLAATEGISDLISFPLPT